MKYIDGYGLINSRPDETNAENATLWTCENYLLHKQNGTFDKQKKDHYRLVMNQQKISTGIYAQNPYFIVKPPVHKKDESMSRDQLFALVGMSYLLGESHHIDIWKEILRQKGRYDNVNPDKPNSWFTPWDLLFVAYCAGNWIGKLLIWIVAITCIISCLSNKETTSGKLLAYVRCQILKDKSFIMKLCWKLCTKLINKKHGDWSDVFYIYFRKQEDHPNIIEARKAFR